MRWSVILVLFSIATTQIFLAGCQGKRGAESSSALKPVYFEFNSSFIKPSMVKVLDGNTQYLKKHRTLEVVLEGHCDERGTNEYNLALGDHRAGIVKDYLTNKGVSTTRLRTVSYGEEKPVDVGHDESAWFRNRRVEFVRQ